MKKAILITILFPLLALQGISQSSGQVFDTIQFNKNLEFVNHLIEYEYYTQQAIDTFAKSPETSGYEWFSFKEGNNWHCVGGNSSGDIFQIKSHIFFDSLYRISVYTGISDSIKLATLGSALALANTKFQIIRDTSSIYFNPFVIPNADQSISVWYLPAFQPSGQAIYGCEWEYIFDKEGKNLISSNSYTKNMTGVWIGQPRELWLNYRATDKPTIGSIFFAQSFRDYFTRIRIDTRISTSTTTKTENGNYTWIHKMK